MPRLTINGHPQQVDVDPDTPLLWVLRDNLGLTGTRYGCGIAQCGACTVHIDGVAARSCSVPVGAVEDSAITTIEGLSVGADQAQGVTQHPQQRGVGIDIHLLLMAVDGETGHLLAPRAPGRAGS